ncbi:hypothetical protein Tco_0105784 [Tanacetum coccineum]
MGGSYHSFPCSILSTEKDHGTTQKGIDKAWSVIERLAQYEEEGWNDAFIPDEKKRVRQLEDYMRVIAEEFMKFSLKVTRRLKERIKENENKPRKIEKITKYPDTKVLENSAKYEFLENFKKKTFPTPANLLCVRYIRILPSSPSQPQKSTFVYKPKKRAN